MNEKDHEVVSFPVYGTDIKVIREFAYRLSKLTGRGRPKPQDVMNLVLKHLEHTRPTTVWLEENGSIYPGSGHGWRPFDG